MKNVCLIETALKELSDEGVNLTYQTSLVMFGFLVRSFNELNNMIKANEFKKLFPKGSKHPKIDTLKVIDMKDLNKMNQSIVKKIL